ncbi:MAG: alpha/beta hydrolase [Gemmatimonadales bacterium]
MRYITIPGRGVIPTLFLIAAACSPKPGDRLETGRADTGAVADSAATLDAPAKPNEEMQQVLTSLTSLGPKPITGLSAVEARKQPSPADAVKALLKKEGKSTAAETVGRVENRTIKGPGGPVPIRIYTPKGKGPFPVVVYYHGGGWVIADLDTYDASPRAIANLANAVVVSSHYRQGPEHKFPAAHEDAFAAYKWALTNAKSINGDPTRVAVMGESAGGGLAGAVSIMARDSGVQLPVHQVLVYPIAGHDLNTPSYQENADAKPLNKPMMAWFFEKYLGSPKDGGNPLIDLVHADLSGLPPATVINAQIDPLRSEGEQLAKALETAGVDTKQKTYDGVTHEFFGMGSVLDEAKDAEQMAADGLKSAFGKTNSAAR